MTTPDSATPIPVDPGDIGDTVPDQWAGPGSNGRGGLAEPQEPDGPIEHVERSLYSDGDGVPYDDGDSRIFRQGNN